MPSASTSFAARALGGRRSRSTLPFIAMTIPSTTSVLREDFLLLQALEQGQSLGEAIEAAFADSATPESDRPALIQSAFHHWMQMGWLCAPRSEEEAL